MAANISVSSINSDYGPTYEDQEYCAACTREARKVEASKFCEDCDEQLCEKCVHDHRKFVVTKSHTIIDNGLERIVCSTCITGEEMPGCIAKQKAPPVGPKPEMTEKCTHHEGKVLELYCVQHDELCCSVCVAVSHRGCMDVDYIPQSAVGIESSFELLEVKESLKKVHFEVNELRSKREKDQQSVHEQKEDIINAIIELRIRISDTLDNLERQARTELQTKYDTLMTKVGADVKTCDDVSHTLTGFQKKLDTITNNESELFVQVKKAKKSLTEGKAVIENIPRNVGKEKLSFMADRSLENLLSTLTSLGSFSEDTHMYTAQFEGEFNMGITTGTHKDAGTIDENTGSLLLPDGRMIFTNMHHKRLKLVSGAFRLMDYCDLLGKPYDLCRGGPNEVIVSLREEKVLQFVTIEKKMRTGRTVRIGVSCYGVASKDGEIYVACIGGSYENRPQLRVYNMSGRMLRLIEKDAEGVPIFAYPRNIAVSPDGTMLHVTDRENGVITIGIYGKVISVYNPVYLDSPRGITVDPNGNLFVCGQNSHNVIQLDGVGEEVGVLLKEIASFHRPQSVLHVQKQHKSSLAVTFFKSKMLKVYALA